MTGTLANETEPGQLPPLIDVAFVERCYPDMKGVSFLDHAAASPLPRPSIDAMIAMTKRLGRPDYPDALMIADRLRRRIAQLVNSDPRSVALTGQPPRHLDTVAITRFRLRRQRRSCRR